MGSLPKQEYIADCPIIAHGESAIRPRRVKHLTAALGMATTSFSADELLDWSSERAKFLIVYPESSSIASPPHES